MLLLDTNTLYYIAGLSGCIAPVNAQQLIKQIDAIGAHDNVAISSVSLFEFLTKYRNQAGTVRRVRAFMRQHHIEICQNIYLEYMEKYDLSKIKQKELDCLIAGFSSKKINIESRFATLIFFILSLSSVIFETLPNSNNISPVYIDLVHRLFVSHCDLFLSLFNYAYSEAYKTDDAENMIRNKFYDMLRIYIQSLLPVFRNLSEINALEDVEPILKNLSIVKLNDDACLIRKKILRQKTTMKYIQKKAIEYRKQIKDKHNNELLEGIIGAILEKVEVESIREYLTSISKRCILEGGAFMKNDINDALILSSLSKNDRILTFDKGVIQHMEKYSSVREEYKNSLTLINTLREI